MVHVFHYLLQAFERARAEAKISTGKLVRITERYYRVALDFARDYFMHDEPISGNAGVIWGPDVEEGWLDVFRQGYSLMIVSDDDKEEVISFRCTQVIKLENDPYKLDQISDPGTRRIWAHVDYCDKKAKVLEHFNATEALYLASLGVKTNYRQKGIAFEMMQAALLMYQYLGVEPICIKGEASSNYSKKVYAKTGFQQFYDMPYEDYIVDGEQVFKNTGVHKSLASLGQVLKGKTMDDA